MGICCAADTSTLDNAVLMPGDLQKKPSLFGVHTGSSSDEESDIALDEKLRNLASKVRLIKKRLDDIYKQ